MTERTYNYDIRTFQKRSIVLLTAIDKVCKEHNLTYYIIAGTLLGAVRHKGFIPWDDDMDIALMRDDYDKLMQHADEWVPEPFYVVNHENTPHYPKYFAKLEDTSTTIVERFYLGYAGGIYMDIFPLDDVPDNKLLRSIHFYKFNLSRRLLYFLYRDPYKHGHTFGARCIKMLQSLVDKKTAHDMAQRILREYHNKKSCNYVMTHDDGNRAYHKSVFMQPTIEEFEGVKACAPTIPHGFLSVLYGDDYMLLPPVEKRVSHFHDYCDLEKPYRDFSFEQLGGSDTQTK